MKILIAALFLIQSIALLAVPNEVPIVRAGMIQEIQIVKNEFNDSVPEGMFKVRGAVRELYYYQVVLDSVLIADSSEVFKTRTDSNGKFEILFPISVDKIFCYKPGFNELILNGPFLNRHLIEVNFGLHNPEIIIITAKPVIYVYNTPKPVSLELKAKGQLTFTYPAMESNKWLVQSNDDGTLENITNNKTYPYLFWEAENPEHHFVWHNQVIDGWYINTDTCVRFLENTLSAYGLNSKESTDFITYWAPKIIEKQYAMVQFISGEDYEHAVGELAVDPKPESILRLYMYVKLFDDSNWQGPKLSSPVIEPFERGGFTVVEWGGSVLPYNVSM